MSEKTLEHRLFDACAALPESHRLYDKAMGLLIGVYDIAPREWERQAIELLEEVDSLAKLSLANEE